MAPNHALVLRAGDELARAARWAELPEDELRRRATHAANERDAGQLVELTLAYLRINRSRLADSTAASYAHAIRLLIAGWSNVNLLRAGANAGALWVRRLEGVDPPLSPSTIAGRLAGVRALYRALRWSGA
ncbi:MAG: site-specific integrase, partial [Chloroflexota bacterium]